VREIAQRHENSFLRESSFLVVLSGYPRKKRKKRNPDKYMRYKNTEAIIRIPKAQIHSENTYYSGKSACGTTKGCVDNCIASY